MEGDEGAAQPSPISQTVPDADVSEQLLPSQKPQGELPVVAVVGKRTAPNTGKFATTRLPSISEIREKNLAGVAQPNPIEDDVVEHQLPSHEVQEEESSSIIASGKSTMPNTGTIGPTPFPSLEMLRQRKLPGMVVPSPRHESDGELSSIEEGKKKEKKKKGRKQRAADPDETDSTSSSSSSSSQAPKKRRPKKRSSQARDGKKQKKVKARRRSVRHQPSDDDDDDEHSSSSSSSSHGEKIAARAHRRLNNDLRLCCKRKWLLCDIVFVVPALAIVAFIGLAVIMAWTKAILEYHSSQVTSSSPVQLQQQTSTLDAAVLLQTKKPLEESDESFTMSRLRRNTELRFYVDKSVLAQRTQPLALVGNVTNLVRGYARALSMCATLSNALGITGVMQTIPGAEDRMLDDLYLSSSSAYSPFFCMNVPISAIVHTNDVRARDEQQLRDVREAGSKMPLFPIDADVVDQIARMASQTLQMASISWQQLTAPSYVAALHTEASRSAVASSPVHSATALGYSANAFFARDLEALGNLSDPKSLLQLVPYDYFPDVGRLVFGDHQNSIILGTTACVCGLHLGLPRNLIFYFDSQAPRGRVTLEPVITQGGRSASHGPVPLVTASGLPWANQLSDERHGVSAAYLALDEALRKAAGLEGGMGFPATNKITIDSMRLPWVNQRHLENHGQRVLRTVEGAEALCIQYCQYLAYTLKTKALELPPTERDMTRNGGTASP